MRNALEIDNLTFRHSEQFGLEQMTATIPYGKMTSIMGPNGSGKSTMLRLLAKLIVPQQGTVYVQGQPLSSLKTKRIAQLMSMLPQTQEYPHDLTVRDLVTYGRLPHRKWYEKLRSEDRDVIDWAIEATKLAAFQYRQVASLSGGERQRAWIAMTLAQQTGILLLDEPTTYLDIAHQLEVFDLVRQLCRSLRMTVVMVLHDINHAARYSDYLIVMKDGRMAAHGEPKRVLNAALFRDVFGIDAKILYDDGIPIIAPIQA